MLTVQLTPNSRREIKSILRQLGDGMESARTAIALCDSRGWTDNGWRMRDLYAQLRLTHKHMLRCLRGQYVPASWADESHDAYDRYYKTPIADNEPAMLDWQFATYMRDGAMYISK